MKKFLLVALIVMPLVLSAQSSIAVGTGSSITIGAGSNISAGSRTGTFYGGGTFNDFPVSSPYLQISRPTNVLAVSATLNATLNPQGYGTTYYFSYGTDPSNLSSITSTQNAGSGSSNLDVSANVAGLTENTLYYYKITATNVYGTSNSNTTVLFTNNSITRTNLALWIRADQGITSSGNYISEWKDLTGNNNNVTQSTGANQPLFVDAAINGKAVARFNGSSSKMQLPTSTTLEIQSNPYEMFVVAKSASSNIQFLIAGGATEQFEYHLNGSSGARFIPIASTYLDLGTAATYSDGNAHVFSARVSSSGGAVRVDGIDGGTSSLNITSSNSGTLLLGVRSDGSYYFNGDIAEVILYNALLNESDRNTVEHYLANRYGITSGALPVELTSFSAECRAQSVELKWTTATEVNNYGFAIERSAISNQQSTDSRKQNADSWQKIGFVQGHGNSNSPKNYSFTDNLANTLAHNLNLLQYRLKQIDFDGKYEYSNVVEVKLETPTQFSLAQNYPNPFNPATTINYQLPVSGHVTLKVYDVLGREVATLVDEFKQAGNYKVVFNVETRHASFLPSGVYFYKLQTDNGFSETKRLMVIK